MSRIVRQLHSAESIMDIRTDGPPGLPPLATPSNGCPPIYTDTDNAIRIIRCILPFFTQAIPPSTDQIVHSNRNVSRIAVLQSIGFKVTPGQPFSPNSTLLPRTYQPRFLSRQSANFPTREYVRSVRTPCVRCFERARRDIEITASRARREAAA